MSVTPRLSESLVPSHTVKETDWREILLLQVDVDSSTVEEVDVFKSMELLANKKSIAVAIRRPG